MADDRDAHNRLENTITRIGRLYPGRQWDADPEPPIPAAEYAQTVTGQSLAEVIEVLEQEHTALATALPAPGDTPVAAPGDPFLGAPATPVAPPVDVPAPPPDGRAGPAGYPSAADEIDQFMRELEPRLRACVEAVASRREQAAERRLEAGRARLREAAKVQIKAQEVALRKSYEAKYRKRELVLREHYKKLMLLARRISAQKLQVQKARQAFEERLQAANELYRQVEEMRRLLRNHLGGLEERISRDLRR